VVERPVARAAVMAAILMTYTLLNAWEFYRARSAGLMSRWPLIAILLGHAAIFLLRVPLAATLTDADTRHAWFVVFSLEAMLAAFCGAYLLGSLARERVVMDHKNASLIDPLTGVANRRAFFEQGERLLRRVLHGRRPAAVLVFDLDRFKVVNDSFGHPAGDQVLVTFCEIATAALRPGDLFARIGGEEFACLLPNAGRHGAVQVAERVRERLSVTPVTAGETSITATVSIGAAVSEGWSQDLAQLVTAADEALYTAKRNGRDRVEIAAPRLALARTTFA
jgi:diguanylate cyclase (GGDEF)-like protein